MFKSSHRLSSQFIPCTPLSGNPSFSFSTTIQPDPRIGLAEEQLEIQRLARDFSENELKPHSQKWDSEAILPLEVLREMGQLGFGAIYASDEYGGSGLSRLDASVIFEALAQGDVPVTAYLSIHNMGCWMIDTWGTSEQKEQWLPSLATMDTLISYCLTEPGSGSDASSLRTKAVADGDDYVITGSKAFISGAGTSDYYLTMVRTDPNDPGPKGISTVIIPKDAKGIEFGKAEHKLGWNAQPTRIVSFDQVRIPKSFRLGEEGQGFTFAMKGLDGGRINIASCSLGGAQRAIEETKHQLNTRKQFGKEISQFQYPAFKFADMMTELQASRLMVRSAAQALDQKRPTATMECAMAKRYATDACHQITSDAVQLHGGYGVLKEYPVEQLFRDLRIHQILEGTNEIMRLIVSRAGLTE